MANIVMLRNALDHALEYPEQHDQKSWMSGSLVEDWPEEGFVPSEYRPGMAVPGIAVGVDNGDHPPCGTTLCLAGWIAFLYAPSGTKLFDDYVYLPDGTRRYIKPYVRELAGLDEAEAEALFIEASDANDLDRTIGEIADGCFRIEE